LLTGLGVHDRVPGQALGISLSQSGVR
jgi:hypothetical protein